MDVKRTTNWNPQAAPTFWINHASRLVLRLFEQRLRPLGFGFAYVPVVAALEDTAPLTQKELIESAHVEQPTMAALLARMERDGVISRTPHPADQRASLIALTAKAKSRLPKAREQLRQGAEQALAGLSKQERATLLALLQRVVANLSAAAE
ncbi:MAG TPA: MarR family transcriptional regulator [Polyangiales bacterium]|nr:MarR family transcriptional regulator [Polyangiales bacterium]